MTAAVLLAATLAAVSGAGPARRRQQQRLADLVAPSRREVPGDAPGAASAGSGFPGTAVPGRPTAALTAALAAAVAAVALVPSATGAVLAAAAAAVAFRWVRRLPSRDRLRAARRSTGALPLTLDLLAACLRAGCTPTEALHIAADACDEPELADLLAGTGAGVAGPADPVPAMAGSDAPAAALDLVARLAGLDPPGAPAFAAAAARLRSAERAALAARAGTVAVRAVGPLVACFLPAFVLVGVVPTVAALLHAAR